MEVFLNVLLLVFGFVLLVKGADIFVEGSSMVAKLFHIPSIIVGLTIVSLGTSLPELAVSTTAALRGSNEIALGNVVGSNLFNSLVVLGATAIVAKSAVPVDRSLLRVEFPLNLLATALLGVFGIDLLVRGGIFESGTLFSFANKDVISGTIARNEGLLLLAAFVGFLSATIRRAMKARREDAEAEETEAADTSSSRVLQAVLRIVAGAVMIKFGGDFVVSAAQVIAAALGMSEALIGLTIVACGTSLPELVTSVVAARKDENDLAVGNVIGSNLFNILFILGVSTSIHPVAVTTGSVVDILVLLGTGALLTLFCATRQKVNRGEGVVLVLIYACYLGYIIVR